MKKTFKKAFSLLLTLLMIFSAVPMQGFAALDSLKMPEITAVEIVGEDKDKAVSFKEIDEFFTEIFERFEEIMEDMDLNFDVPSDLEQILAKYPYLNSLIDYDMFYSGVVDYDFEVTLSNGDKITVKNEDYYVQYKKIFSIYAGAYVSYEDYLEAKESGADKITLNVGAEIENDILEDYVEPNTFKTQVEVPMVKCYVKSIAPVSGFPKKVYEYCDYYELDGAKFKVTFSDGTSKTLTAKQHIDFDTSVTNYVSYTLGDAELFVSEADDEVLEIEYLDAVKQVDVKYYDDATPFESVKITNYVFDETVGLTSISYDITLKSGGKKSFTKDFSSESNVVLLPYGILDVYKGFYVVLNPYPDMSEGSDEQYDAGYLYFTVTAGDKSDSVKIETSVSAEMNTIYRLLEKIGEIIEMLKTVISNLFGVIAG